MYTNDDTSMRGPRISIDIEVENPNKEPKKINKLKLPKPTRPETPEEQKKRLLPKNFNQPDLSLPPDLVFVDGHLVDDYVVFLFDQRIQFTEDLEPSTVVRIRWNKDNFIYDKRIILTERTRIVYWANPADNNIDTGFSDGSD
jgi:hypothetical protein